MQHIIESKYGEPKAFLRACGSVLPSPPSTASLLCLLLFFFFFPLFASHHINSTYKWNFSLLPVYFLQGIFSFFFFFLLALPKGLIWKYHILTGENTLLADLFAVTASFLKQSSREEIFVFQRRKKMSCSASVKDNELSLSLTVKPLEKYNRPWERGLDIDVLAILVCLGTWWLPCLCRKKIKSM